MNTGLDTSSRKRNDFAVSFVVVLMVLVSFSGCSSPTSPTPPPTGDFTLTANVVGEGAPVAGAALDLYYGTGGDKIGQAVSGEDGRAVFTGLGSGMHKLWLIDVFGFRTPVLRDVSVDGNAAVDLQLEPKDDAALTCVQQSGGDCLKDGDTLYWPLYDLRFSGPVKSVSYPLESLKVVVDVLNPFGAVTDTIQVASVNAAVQLVQGRSSLGITPEGEWYHMLGTEDDPSYPCKIPSGAPSNEAFEVLCYSQITYSGARVNASGVSGTIATGSGGTFTFNLVRREQ